MQHRPDNARSTQDPLREEVGRPEQGRTLDGRTPKGNLNENKNENDFNLNYSSLII